LALRRKKFRSQSNRRYSMAVWRFEINGDAVQYGRKKRTKLTENGCNEPYKDRYWCPKLQWFQSEPCPFLCPEECKNFETMCGVL
jgi:hypothetical protein